jgi:hypothetical protein
MSSHPNHRREHDRVQERGPRYESPDPSAGCNSTHVARARAGWRKINRRKRRREENDLTDVSES